MSTLLHRLTCRQDQWTFADHQRMDAYLSGTFIENNLEAQGDTMSDLPETDPRHVYCILQGAGIVKEGRPIRGNFYCYRLLRHHSETLRDLLGHNDAPRNDDALMTLLNEHERPWSQNINREGVPMTRDWKKPHTQSDSQRAPRRRRGPK